ncbi:DNA-binding protein [Paraburkholderia sp.]|uniref:DNA-binding protein n=1 Tax=Paraburkholderia sp. TaxID=1926495 RepID=UPI0025DD29CA|nr:DNA-binding protein [Paraburkholderia sp.]
MSRISDTRLRTREAAARLVTAGRLAHELTVDLIYAEIRQGSRTTINDELKLWKDEQARNDALAAALPPAVANAMLSVWALAVEQGERVFAQRGDELEAEAAAAITRAGTLETANAELQGELRTVRARLDNQHARLAAMQAEHAKTDAERDAAHRQAETAVAERDAVRAQSEQTLRELQAAHMRELEALRTTHAQHEAALRGEVDQATARLESVQKHVMLQTEEARGAQRRSEAALSDARQRNEQLVADVQRISAEADEHRRLAGRHERQLGSVLEEARDLRRERDALARQAALLQGQLKARDESSSARKTRRARQETS